MYEETFATLERAAIAGERCPISNWERTPDQPRAPQPTVMVISEHLQALARAGKIRIDISGRNFRQVTILVGPHAGKQTAPNPNPTARVWQTISAAGKSLDISSQRFRGRPQPSAPRDISAPHGLRDLKERK